MEILKCEWPVYPVLDLPWILPSLMVGLLVAEPLEPLRQYGAK